VVYPPEDRRYCEWTQSAEGIRS
jgi:hypothetical protein